MCPWVLLYLLFFTFLLFKIWTKSGNLGGLHPSLRGMAADVASKNTVTPLHCQNYYWYWYWSGGSNSFHLSPRDLDSRTEGHTDNPDACCGKYWQSAHVHLWLAPALETNMSTGSFHSFASGHFGVGTSRNTLLVTVKVNSEKTLIRRWHFVVSADLRTKL